MSAKPLLLFCLLLAGRLAAQTTIEVPAATARLNLMPLINGTKQGLIVAGDIRLASRVSVDAGAGWYFHSPNLVNEQGEYYRGYALRAGGRYYFRRWEEDGSFHLGIETKYNNIRHFTYRQAFRQGQQYIELLPVHRRVSNYGASVRMGWPRYWGPQKRFVFEPVLGLGIQYFRVSRDLPPDAELIEENILFTFERPPGFERLADVYLGIWVGVVWW